jgi:CDP-glucose 4,6-dehydratase
LYKAAEIDDFIEMHWGDIQDEKSISKAIGEFKPELVFHLAAQALVGESYANPVDTFEINAGGTVKILNAIRSYDFIKSVVLVTSDKCYYNIESDWGYRENDRLGGKDPYSASKAAAEIMIYSYICSFFKDSKTAIASARAGNVIGGGDWAAKRIVPDCARSWAKNEKTLIRNPSATRPWQHVLEPLSGYLILAQKLYEEPDKFHGESFNFGPLAEQNHTVEELITEISKVWPNAGWTVEEGEKFHEAKLLKLCCDKPLAWMKWQATLNFFQTADMTASWYKEYYSGSKDIKSFTINQIAEYENKIKFWKND